MGFDRGPIDKPDALLVARLAQQNAFERAVLNPPVAKAPFYSGASLKIGDADELRLVVDEVARSDGGSCFESSLVHTGAKLSKRARTFSEEKEAVSVPVFSGSSVDGLSKGLEANLPGFELDVLDDSVLRRDQAKFAVKLADSFWLFIQACRWKPLSAATGFG